jgi:hypothetical protein
LHYCLARLFLNLETLVRDVLPKFSVLFPCAVLHCICKVLPGGRSGIFLTSPTPALPAVLSCLFEELYLCHRVWAFFGVTGIIPTARPSPLFG